MGGQSLCRRGLSSKVNRQIRQESYIVNLINSSLFGPRGPLVLPLIGPPARPSACKNFFSSSCCCCWGRPIANDHPEEPTSCKSSSRGASLLQIIIQRGRLFANDHSKGWASCKWSSWVVRLLQIIIWRGWPFANDHPERPASYKGSSGWNGLMQMIIQRGQPLGKWSLKGTGLLQMIIRRGQPRQNQLLEQFVLVQ